MKNCICGLYRSETTSDITGELHRHNVYQLIYIKRGTVRLCASEAVYLCAAPCLIFINSLELHSVSVVSKEYERIIMSVDPSVAGQQIKPEYLLTVFSTHRADFCHSLDVSKEQSEIELLFSCLTEEYQKSDGDGMAVWLTALLHRIFRTAPELFRSAESQAEKTVAAVRGELERNLADDLNLDEIAAKFYISRYYLAHIFKSVTGYSVKQYRLLCRLSYARELLVNTELTVSEISEQTGFNDTSNFARYFREKTGLTPTGYRASLTGKTIE